MPEPNGNLKWGSGPRANHNACKADCHDALVAIRKMDQQNKHLSNRKLPTKLKASTFSANVTQMPLLGPGASASGSKHD